MNSTGISAPATAAKPSTTAPAVTVGVAAANDENGSSADFAALLCGGAAVAAASGSEAEPKTSSDKSAASDDAKTQDTAAAPADSALPDWLQALRGSLTLVVAMFAPTSAACVRPGKLAAALPTKPSVTPTGTNASTGVASAKTDSAAISALTAASETDSALPTDTATPTADRRFDALLVTMSDHAAATLPPASAGNLASGALAVIPTAVTTAAPATVSPMTVPPDHPQFINDLGERIVWITNAGLSSAKIELHPLDLGSISVHVQMRGDTAQVAFAADNPATRALLQDSLPQLRELMSVQGLQLLRAQVDQKVGATRASDTRFSQSRERDGDSGQSGTPLRRVTRLELVDAYV